MFINLNNKFIKNILKNCGFTLVELLVAIIIVSVVSTIGAASYTGYVRESRDSSRVSALSQIKGYLDQYYSANSKYPDCASCSSNSGQRVWITGLDPYATILPTDPLNETGSPLEGKYSFLYKSYNSGQSYDLIALLEDSNDPYRCEAIKYRGGESDNDLLCPSDSSAFKKRLVEISKGL